MVRDTKFRELEPSMWKAFNRKYNFAGIRRILVELEDDNWKHRSNYTVTLSEKCYVFFVVELTKWNSLNLF